MAEEDISKEVPCSLHLNEQDGVATPMGSPIPAGPAPRTYVFLTQAAITDADGHERWDAGVAISLPGAGKTRRGGRPGPKVFVLDVCRLLRKSFATLLACVLR